MTTIVVPTSLGRKNGTDLIVTWNDGSRTDYNLYELRTQCPCASCVNEWTGEKILDRAKIPKNILPIRLYSVGRYALVIQWNDGHSTGIYSYDYLRHLNQKSA